MKIAVFGATGATGSKVVARALASGHEVVAIARRPQAVKPRSNLKVFRADVLAAASLVEAVEGAAAVISCIGPAKNLSPGTVVSKGTSNIMAACQRAGVRRLVMQSGITVSEGSELSIVNRWAIRILRQIFSKACNDKAIAERNLQKSDLDWVIVRPAGLRETVPLFRYTAGPGARISPLAPLSFSDCADCLVRATTETAWAKKIINVGR